MRAMRRIQGKGKAGEELGSRSIFAEARKRGRITSDVYIASALMEYHCYKDPSATKIFERGAKLFPQDENFALEYLKHLIDINDIINARAVFETTARRFASDPETVQKAKPIFAFLHEYESRYGDLVQVINLENRMRELFPEDPSLDRFSHRYTTPTFDPVYVRPVLSPSQTQPKTLHAGVKPEIQTSPAPGQHDMSFSSPKRPYPSEDFDYDSDRPRKFVRAESPLKAAQGRRLDQQKRGQAINGQVTSHYKPQGSPAPLPREVVQLLNNIPHASAYHLPRLSPEKMVDLIRRTDIPASPSQIPLPANARGLGTAQSGVNAYGGAYR
ncbi:mRNA 3'-end-processing protein rna14 [Penicillium manginii]|uniref:mRNA 3'-end-processing protein rna14 n=1 Tax=Penicillium manginii TaxID=203109 RepID=UPI00254956DF|nr:mRNA 3'-end-processing protein rna14 [Penicillium manginii]KAJ5749978.1 mRNA 3'-end-processing protein rna14 [Penicillium manginii]